MAKFSFESNFENSEFRFAVLEVAAQIESWYLCSVKEEVQL